MSNGSESVFANRGEAGRMLAGALGKYAGRYDVVVLGLPRGGVPVAAEVARALRAPLDVLVVRKLGAPGQEETAHLLIGLFGASTGAAAALVAAAELQAGAVRTVVSRGGRPDLARESLALVRCPVLLMVGGHDNVVIDLNKRARALMRCETELVIVPGATHLFEEEGALEEVADLAAAWLAERVGKGT